VETTSAPSRPTEPYLNTRPTKASMRLKVANTNRLRDSHYGSQTQTLVHTQPHRDSLETIELLPLVVHISVILGFGFE
jgi:hypothetical protein